MFAASTPPLQHRVSNAFRGVWVPAFAGTTDHTKNPGNRPGLFRILQRCRDQAAGAKIFEALALIGSKVAVVLACMNSSSLAEYSLAPLPAEPNTASMVLLWLSATSLNFAYESRACDRPFSASARICSGAWNGMTEAENGSVELVIMESFCIGVESV